MYIADPRVDAYVAALPGWQQAVCRDVRALAHAADPAVGETIKRTVRPYLVLDGNICALLAATDHVNVFLYDGGIVPDPERIVTVRAEAVYVGLSAGSMVLAPSVGEDFVRWKPSTGGDSALGMVNFAMFPTWITPLCRRTP